MAVSLNRLLLGLVGAPLLVLVGIAVTLSAQVASMVRDEALVDHTDQVLGAIQDVQRHIVDEETGLRGFQLSGDDAFLEPYRNARVDPKLASLRALVEDNEAQVRRVDELGRRHRAWRADADAALSDPRARERENLLRRKATMDAMRADVDGLTSVEDGLRAARAERAERSIRLTEGLTVGLLVGLAALLLLVSRRQATRITGTFGSALDAERRAREASEALVTSLRRQESFRETFLKMLGHDLRNPLTAVSMAASYSLEQPDLSPKSRRMLDRVVSSAERMGKMVDQLIDLTRARLGEAFPVVFAEVDLAGLALRVVEARRASSRQHFAITRAGNLVVQGDEARLEQVLTNLVGNAATHGDGREVHVTLRGTEDAVVVSVRNGGDPIPPSVAAKLFDPFQRGPEDKMRSEALGLGLYISQRIVEAHGGTLRARSEPGVDVTELEVVLPRLPPAARSRGRA